MTIVVVDNEESPETKAICDEFAPKMIYPLRYCWELRPGLAHVRNKAIEVARQFADAIAFIDEHEVPSPGWLKYLASCQRAYGADVVSGPVIPCYLPNIPQWIRAGRFFEMPRYVTGTELPEGRIGNVLIRMEVFDRIGTFDERFALTGGEDMDFFVRFHESGGRIRWSNEAVTEEWLPPCYTTLSHVLQGSYQRAKVNAIRACRSRLSLSMHIICGVLRSTLGIYLLLASLLRGKVESVKALQRIWSGAGTIAGATTPHGGHYPAAHSV
jgi:glycosyltransferase involved in cell wall biosynthesis